MEETKDKRDDYIEVPMPAAWLLMVNDDRDFVMLSPTSCPNCFHRKQTEHVLSFQAKPQKWLNRKHPWIEFDILAATPIKTEREVEAFKKAKVHYYNQPCDAASLEYTSPSDIVYDSQLRVSIDTLYKYRPQNQPKSWPITNQGKCRQSYVFGVETPLNRVKSSITFFD